MARKPEQHRIDDAAKRCLHEIFDNVSVPNNLQPDYGIDFRLQILDGDTLSSSVFLVQLKGQRRFSTITRNRQVLIRQKLSSQRLADYFDIHHEPVFLLVVDTSSNEARYLFMQGYANSPFLPQDWKKSVDVTVYVPDGNDPRAINLFRRDLDNALSFMSNKYPGTPEAAIRAATNKYKRLDPRFDVTWSFDGGKPFPAFVPKADARVNLKVIITTKGDDAVARIQRLLDSGLPTQFSPEEIAFSGSPLYEHELPKRPIMLSMGRNHKIQLSLVRLGQDGAEVSRLDGLYGNFIEGKGRCHFRASLPDDSLIVTADDLPYDGAGHPLSIAVKPGTWFDAPVLDLPRFNQLLTVFAVHDKFPLSIRVLFCDSGKVFAFPTSIQAFPNVGDSLQLIAKLRGIAQTLRINPRIRRDPTNAIIADIHRVHEILTKGKLVKSLGKGVITLTTNRDGAKHLLAVPSLDNVAVTLTEQIDFFDSSIELGECIRSFNYLFVRDRQSVLQAIASVGSDSIAITLEGREGSTITETIRIGMVQPKSLGTDMFSH